MSTGYSQIHLVKALYIEILTKLGTSTNFDYTININRSTRSFSRRINFLRSDLVRWFQVVEKTHRDYISPDHGISLLDL